MLAGFTVIPSVVVLGRETIYRDGERVGWLTSGGYGYTIADRSGTATCGIPRVSPPTMSRVATTSWKLADTECRPTCRCSPLYDPTNAR